MSIDCIGPLPACMYQHCLCMLLQLSDSLLGDSILEMGINSTKGKCLTFAGILFSPLVVGKPSIVGMIVLNDNAMQCCKPFKSLLC